MRVTYEAHRPPPPPLPVYRTEVARWMSPAELTASVITLRAPAGPVRFAWAKALNRPDKPRVFTTLGALAARIHADREGAVIELENGELDVPGKDDAVFNVVNVYVLFEGARISLLGHAYLDGGGRDRLASALEAAQRPQRLRIRPVH